MAVYLLSPLIIITIHQYPDDDKFISGRQVRYIHICGLKERERKSWIQIIGMVTSGKPYDKLKRILRTKRDDVVEMLGRDRLRLRINRYAHACSVRYTSSMRRGLTSLQNCRKKMPDVAKEYSCS